MSEANFTKLKWGLEKDEFDDSGEWFEIHASSEKYYISKHIADVYSGEGDAHLIAAAPEMYEMLGVALVEMQSLIDECNASRMGMVTSQTLTEPDLIDGETCFRIQELLAKARGEL